MSELAVAAAVFVAANAGVGLVTAGALRSARRDGTAGPELVKRLLPFLLADLALTALLVLWLLTNPSGG